MLCSVCGANMKEYDEHYRCSNRNCGLKYNKCIYETGPVSLHPVKHSRFTGEQKKTLTGTAILGVFVVGFMLFLGGI